MYLTLCQWLYLCKQRFEIRELEALALVRLKILYGVLYGEAQRWKHCF